MCGKRMGEQRGRGSGGRGRGETGGRGAAAALTGGARVEGAPRTYVQDRIRTEAAQIATLLNDARTYVYICGLKGMETGVDEAFADACRHAGMEWVALKTAMREGGRYHVETY